MMYDNPPLVSVIIPAYNNESRIADTLRSVIAQDYPALEIIVVNDASTDSTQDAARDALEGCGREFSIIEHKNNRGVSAARNTGLDAAKGGYVWFCDGDDLADRRLVPELMALIMKHDCDAACCGFIHRYEDGSPDVLHKLNIGAPETLDGEAMTWARLLKKIEPHFCGIVFKRDFLIKSGVRFSEGCTAGEDVEFQIKAFCCAKNVALTPECLYFYIHHPGMGQVRDKDSKDKVLRRYGHNTEAHFRTAEYLMQHAPSRRLKSLAENLLLPEAVIRRLTLLARSGDKPGFDAVLNDGSTKKILRRSIRFFPNKPEVFLKALCLLCFPGLYYRARS